MIFSPLLNLLRELMDATYLRNSHTLYQLNLTLSKFPIIYQQLSYKNKLTGFLSIFIDFVNIKAGLKKPKQFYVWPG